MLYLWISTDLIWMAVGKNHKQTQCGHIQSLIMHCLYIPFLKGLYYISLLHFDLVAFIEGDSGTIFLFLWENMFWSPHLHCPVLVSSGEGLQFSFVQKINWNYLRVVFKYMYLQFKSWYLKVEVHLNYWYLEVNFLVPEN